MLRPLILSVCLAAGPAFAATRLLVTVVEPRSGALVTGLKAEDFAVLDDGRARRVESAEMTSGPVDVMLLVDTSLLGAVVLVAAAGDPWALVGHVRNAGGIFVGEHSFEVLGDYVAGPSHVMPTEGSARYSSPLSVADFVKRISLVALNAEAGARLSAQAAVLAHGEGLTAHARAAEMRTGEGR